MNFKHAQRICPALFLIGWANFMCFAIIALRLGGTALPGKVENGRYYLVNNVGRHILDSLRPQKYTEVPRQTYLYSKVHAYSVLITFPLGLIAGGIGFFIERTERKAAVELSTHCAADS
jgi:hypothetical protein